MPLATSERLATLRSIPLFAGLSNVALEKILDCAAEFDVERGHVLVQLDRPGEGLFIVEEGSVTVELQDRRLELGPGEFFGELALLDPSTAHTARVSASTRTRCLAINRRDFEDLLSSEPAMAMSMLRVMARRLAATNRREVRLPEG